MGAISRATMGNEIENNIKDMEVTNDETAVEKSVLSTVVDKIGDKFKQSFESKTRMHTFNVNLPGLNTFQLKIPGQAGADIKKVTTFLNSPGPRTYSASDALDRIGNPNIKSSVESLIKNNDVPDNAKVTVERNLSDTPGVMKMEIKIEGVQDTVKFDYLSKNAMAEQKIENNISNLNHKMDKTINFNTTMDNKLDELSQKVDNMNIPSDVKETLTNFISEVKVGNIGTQSDLGKVTSLMESNGVNVDFKMYNSIKDTAEKYVSSNENIERLEGWKMENMESLDKMQDIDKNFKQREIDNMKL